MMFIARPVVASLALGLALSSVRPVYAKDGRAISAR